ncbi:P-loop containing nucleoside triphosphate hydrolase protein [Pilobolus umbonatus]|nr:P-loop containing nucleoside triphosphate hydrolase protein [Pilobolus umbonatus]
MSELIEFDELDMSELVEAIDTAENRIQFVSAEEDPIPPPPLPPSTLSFHPLDTEALRTWIYPVNYPIRGYQLNIVRKALFHNTLVALPTGLGKTFIAAVVMYNYYRWFPQSKIIFMAPTRPLVTQQIEACFQICGIPQSDTVVLTGTTHVNDRKQLWDTKRVFFITPQILQNDLQTRHCPATRIVCLVADEAHRATGNYAYTDVIKKISRVHEHFRVLALTATPGSNLDTVQSVIKNLHIQSIEIRTEDSMDIQEYSHGKSIQQILVPLEYSKGATGPVPKIMDDFRTKLFKPLLDDLMRHQAFTTSDPDKASPFALMSARLRYSSNATNVAPYVKKKVTRLFLDAEAASRAYDLLSLHGISPFVDALTGADDEKKTVVRINQNPVVVNMVQSLKRQCAESGFIGHPKQERLLSLVLAHVSQAENSMVMIFSSYRSSVLDICNVLNQHKPMIRAAPFVGQSTTKAGEKGLNQNQQYELIRQFKRHEFNVLVATSIGEEGLDIGELDLIICYDSHSSPIRMVKRMGFIFKNMPFLLRIFIF